MSQHTHHHETTVASGKRFFVATILNAIITIAELIGGLMSGSLALVSDAIHNFTDTFSLILAWIAHVLSGRKIDPRNTFGYRRAQILAAFVNALFLILITVGLIYEAIRGFFQPHEVAAGLMLVVAIIGLVANVVTALMLRRGSEASLNQKAAFLHILADALSSVGVIVAGICIYFWHWNWLDPLLTLLVALYMFKEAVPVLRAAVAILMEGNTQLDVEAIQRDLQAFPVVVNCHHFHAWQIDEQRVNLTFHITMADCLLSEAEQVTDEIRLLLREKYHVDHVTIQVEVEKGQPKSILADEK